MRRTLCAVVVSVFVTIPASAGGAGVFQGLGTLGGPHFYSEASGVSGDGTVVVGRSQSPLGGDEAFRWTLEEGLVALGDLPGGEYRSSAVAVSHDGSVIVGRSQSEPGRQAFRWTAAGGMVGLGDLAGGIFESQGLGVSADGDVVVGEARSGAGREAFRWSPTTGMQGLGDLPGGEFKSLAHDISGDGFVIAGVGWVDPFNRGFRWTAILGMQDLGPLPPQVSSTTPIAISADGSTIVGYTVGPARNEAFRWTLEGGYEVLGDLPGGRINGVATDTNEDGSIVVGNGRTEAGGEAFVWDFDRGMRNLKQVLEAEHGLDASGWTLSLVGGISDDGRVIAGIGRNPDGRNEAWVAILAQRVAIDVKPGSDINPINPMSRGVIPVAILGSDTFDVADVDVTTLAFGPEGAFLAHRNGPHVKDSNDDGLDDLLAHFFTEETGIAFGDTESCVTGELLDGTPFEGCDDITTVPPCGLGPELALLLPTMMWLRRQRRRRIH